MNELTVVAVETIADNVRSEYETRLAARQATAISLERRANQFGNARLVVFLGGLALAYWVIWPQTLSPWWLLLPVILFLVLAIRHDQVLKARARARRAAAFYTAGLHRLNGTWAGTGDPGTRFADDAHPYAADLDLFGRGSLFELISAARTRSGQATLATWLRAPAPTVEEVRARQAAVAELAPRLDLREDTAVLGEETARATRTDVGDTLTAWGEAPPALPESAIGLRAAGALLALLTITGLVLWGTGHGPLLFGSAILLGQLFAGAMAKRVNAALAGVEKAARDLDLLARLLTRIETEPFTAPRLRMLQESLGSESDARPSLAIQRLDTLLEWVEAPRNPFFAPLAAALLWRFQCAFLIDAWRRQYGTQLRHWVAAVGEFEALVSLAGYAHCHPGNVFPEIAVDAEPPVFGAVGLAHPLLPWEAAVRNDVALGGGDGHPRLLLVSGSNMSGKSTLLRAIGASTVLALAGAPIRAQRLRVSRLNVAASLRTQDSLQGGVSRFMAEIRRLRQVAERGEADAPLPLLFLLDEILSGTNSHDRRIGAEGLARALLTKGRGDALGLITTHDLALTEIAADPVLHAANVHFDDQVGEDGRITFDYTLLPGVVTRSNALALMRAVGLDV